MAVALSGTSCSRKYFALWRVLTSDHLLYMNITFYLDAKCCRKIKCMNQNLMCQIYSWLRWYKLPLDFIKKLREIYDKFRILQLLLLYSGMMRKIVLIRTFSFCFFVFFRIVLFFNIFYLMGS